jgi:hypothetical protein
MLKYDHAALLSDPTDKNVFNILSFFTAICLNTAIAKNF